MTIDYTSGKNCHEDQRDWTNSGSDIRLPEKTRECSSSDLDTAVVAVAAAVEQRDNHVYNLLLDSRR